MKNIFLAIIILISVNACKAPQLIIEQELMYGISEEKLLIFKSEKRAERFEKKYGGKLDGSTVYYKGEIPKKYKKRIQ